MLMINGWDISCDHMFRDDIYIEMKLFSLVNSTWSCHLQFWYRYCPDTDTITPLAPGRCLSYPNYLNLIMVILAINIWGSMLLPQAMLAKFCNTIFRPHRGGWGCEVSCGGHHRLRGKSTSGSALDGAVFDIAQILAYLVHNMSRSQLYLRFGHFGWLPFFSVNNILAGLWLNCISFVQITLFLFGWHTIAT